MNGFLLDTNILSALRKPAHNRQLVEFIGVQPTDYLHTSAVTLAEVRLGIELQVDAGRRAELLAWLNHTLRPLFDDRVHAVSEEVLLSWLLINRKGRSEGHVYSQQDSLIAAIAATQQLIVLTRDVAHFVAVRVPTLNPWTATFYDTHRRSHEIDNLISATLLTELRMTPAPRAGP